MFNLIKNDINESSARTGMISTPHGVIETPGFVVVGTHAEVRTLKPIDIPKTATQVIIANTYHLWQTLGEKGLAKYPGLHKAMKWSGPVMTDSGGFQVFSLGSARQFGGGKVANLKQKNSQPDKSLVKITNQGVYFQTEASKQYLDAKKSMAIQSQLGADIIFAFDEPTSPHHSHAYTKASLKRTHKWLEQSLEYHNPKQLLYGIVQGGPFQDLREQSAKFVASLPFDGVAIGGSFGSSFGSSKQDTIDELKWTIPYLPEDKPRHLLGIGGIDDIFTAVEQGIDTFDCVIPTREARHGSLWTKSGRQRIKNASWADKSEPIEINCGCPVCQSNLTRKKLAVMFRAKEPGAARLATIHNIWFFNNLMSEIREAIKVNKLSSLEQSFKNR